MIPINPQSKPMTAKLKRDSILSDYRIALERYTMQLQCELAADLQSMTEDRLDEIINALPNVYRGDAVNGVAVRKIEQIVFTMANTGCTADHDPDNQS